MMVRQKQLSIIFYKAVCGETETVDISSLQTVCFLHRVNYYFACTMDFT